MTTAEFDAAVARFREAPGGEVTITDYFPHGREPYRAAFLKVDLPRAPRQPQDISPKRVAELASQLAVLAVDTDAYLVMSVHATNVFFRLHVSRLLDPDEIGDDSPCATREVEP